MNDIDQVNSERGALENVAKLKEAYSSFWKQLQLKKSMIKQKSFISYRSRPSPLQKEYFQLASRIEVELIRSFLWIRTGRRKWKDILKLVMLNRFFWDIFSLVLSLIRSGKNSIIISFPLSRRRRWKKKCGDVLGVKTLGLMVSILIS